MNHILYIDLTSHNICFTTLSIPAKDELAYAFDKCQIATTTLTRGVRTIVVSNNDVYVDSVMYSKHMFSYITDTVMDRA